MIHNFPNHLLFFLFTTIVMRIVSPSTANMSYVLLAVYAITGPAQAIRALTLSWLFTMLNPSLAAEATLALLGRYIVLFSAAASVLFRYKALAYGKLVNSSVLCTFLLGSFIIVHSILFSPIFQVSILKALSWLLTMITIIAAWSSLSKEERDVLVGQLFVGLVFFMFTSLTLLGFPDIGYYLDGRNFQGIFIQPQVLGITMAMLSAWVIGRMMDNHRVVFNNLILLALCFFSIYISGSRTAGLALFLGVGITALLHNIFSFNSSNHKSARFNNGRSLLIIFLLFTGIGFYTFSLEIYQFLGKGGQATSLTSLYDRSRSILINPMLENIRATPWKGIGFGIASSPALMNIKVDPIWGIPISASVEKVMPFDILEELGVLGLTLVLYWVLMLIRHAAYSGVSSLCIVMTGLLLNIGESILFSPGGVGMLVMIMIGSVYSFINEKV